MQKNRRCAAKNGCAVVERNGLKYKAPGPQKVAQRSKVKILSRVTMIGISNLAVSYVNPRETHGGFGHGEGVFWERRARVER